MRLPLDILFPVIQFIDDQKSLCKVALTCQPLRDPALKELWHKLDSLAPLALLLPRGFYDKDSLEKSLAVLSLPRDRWSEFHPSDTFLARILAYGKYVKVIRGIDSRKYSVDPDTLEFLLERLPQILGVEHIVPNLTRLSLKNDELSVVGCISGLFVSNLRTIVLAFSCLTIQKNYGETVMTALQSCPKLVTLKLISTKSHDEFMVFDIERPVLPSSQELNSQLIAAHSSSLKTVHIIPAKRTGFADILPTASSLAILGHFRSITHLRISLKTFEEFRDNPPFEAPNSAFPSLQYLRLRLRGSAPVTWFFDALDVANLKFLYLHFVEGLSPVSLGTFFSSLDHLKEKFAKVSGLGFRANVFGDEKAAILSVVTAATRLFLSLAQLKLKLFPSSRPHVGLIRAAHLPFILAALPGLRVVKLASNPSQVHLTDVVTLARSFPQLHKIGINFHYSPEDLRDEDAPEASPLPSDGDLAMSGLRTLDVKHSQIVQPSVVAAYLRKHLPRLSNVTRARRSVFRDWDIVSQLLGDRR